MNTVPLEEDTRALINNALSNLGWKWDGADQNVYFERAKTKEEQQKLKGKRPDYVLYQEKSNNPLIVIEAKRKGARINEALEQGIGYARAIGAPLVFATDGVFCKSYHTIDNCTPILNGEELDEFIRETLAIKFLNKHEVNTVSPKVQYDRKELIKIFNETNNMLRGEGLRAGIERFGEFANILFLKLVSETEQIKIESGEKSRLDSFCHWNAIKEIQKSVRIEYINNTVYKRLNGLYKTEIFTPLSVRNENILSEIMDRLDPLMLTDVDSDVKGDAFEYFLKTSTSTKNDLGEYFTPRHIVKTMVRLINPQIGEKIYDPFCGTGGFLIESFRYIYNNMARTESNIERLKNSTVYGNEITNTARIAKMNMILAGDGHSNIEMRDSLSNPIDGTEKGNGFDVVITNMPYSQKSNYGNLYDLPTKNGDSICVQHCIKAINSVAPNGRMALVVPEGFLFRKDLSKTREYLLDRCQLQSIISLPQGVFFPYTGVKTDVIYATKVNQKIKSSEKKKDFWYFDVKSDGYSLDNHRRKLDTPSDLSKYEEYRKLDKDQTDDMLKLGFEIIPIEKVRQNEFVLTGSRYRNNKITSKYKIAKFSDIAILIRGVNYKKTQQAAEETPNIVLTADNITLYGELKIQKEIFVDGTVNLSNEKRLRKEDIFICMSSGSKNHIGKVAFIEQDTNYYAGGFMGIIRTNKIECLPKYLFYYFLLCKRHREEIKILTQGANINNINNTINSILIPLPSIEEQKKIVREIDVSYEIVSATKRSLESYIPMIDSDKEFNFVELKELFNIVSEVINPQEYLGTVNYIGLENIESSTGKIIGDIECDVKSIKSVKRVFKKNDILFGKLRPALNKVAVADYDGICSTDILVLRPKNKETISGLYGILLMSADFNSRVLNGVAGGQLPRVNKEYLLRLPVPQIPYEKQLEKMEKINEEKTLMQSQEEIIKLFTKKIEQRVKEIWE